MPDDNYATLQTTTTVATASNNTNYQGSGLISERENAIFEQKTINSPHHHPRLKSEIIP